VELLVFAPADAPVDAQTDGRSVQRVRSIQPGGGGRLVERAQHGLESVKKSGQRGIQWQGLVVKTVIR